MRKTYKLFIYNIHLEKCMGNKIQHFLSILLFVLHLTLNFISGSSGIPGLRANSSTLSVFNLQKCKTLQTFLLKISFVKGSVREK